MQLRKNKEQIIEQEKKIIYGDEELSGKEKEIGQAARAYTQAAKWFEKNVADDYRRKARNSKYLSIFFGLLTFMSIGAVLGLTPLKTVEPYLVRVDNNSGFTDIVTPLSAGKSPEQVQDEYWLATYVRAYESYNWSSQTSRFALIELLSYGEVFTEYKNFQLSSKGYAETLGKNLQLRTEINNIVLLLAAKGKELQTDKDIRTYQVRFTKTIFDRNGNLDPQSQTTYWLATVSFDYKNLPVTQEDRWQNPMDGILQSAGSQGSLLMKRMLIATLVCAAFAPNLHAETVGRGAALDKRIQTAFYSPNNVYGLNTMKNRISTIQFPPSETVNAGSGLIAAGNPGRWVIGANGDGNMVVVKPNDNAAEPNTNIIIINTNRRTYLVELKITNNPAVMTYLLRFDYPSPPKVGDTPFKGRQLNKNPCDSAINRNYQKQGDMALSPYEMWDNGTFTCLRFPTNAPRPVIYQVLSDGTETLANVRSVNDIMVVHGVSQQFKLRLNSLVLGLRTLQNNTGSFNYVRHVYA